MVIKYVYLTIEMLLIQVNINYKLKVLIYTCFIVDKVDEPFTYVYKTTIFY